MPTNPPKAKARKLMKPIEMWGVIINGQYGEPFLMYIDSHGVTANAVCTTERNAKALQNDPMFQQFSPRLARVLVTELPPPRAKRSRKGKR